MAHNCVVVMAAAPVGFRTVARTLTRKGCSVPRTDTMGAHVYEHGGAVSQWRVMQDTNVPIQARSVAWDVAVT